MIRYLNPTQYKNPSRYAKLRLIKNETENKPYHEVVNATANVDVLNTTLFTVTGVYANRLDLIAEKFYGDSSLWWYIAKQNALEDPTIVPPGSLLQIPKYTSLMTDGRVLEPMSYVYLNLGVDE